MQASQSLIFLPDLDLAEAEQGKVEAQYRVGLYNREQKNYTDAVKWLQKASSQGHTESLYTLAMLYETGEGIAQNTIAALKFYRKAAEQGHAEAKNKVMALYQLIKTNTLPTQQQTPVFLIKPVILSKPITAVNNNTITPILPAKPLNIIYEKQVEKATPEDSSNDSDDSDDDSPSSYAYSQTSQMWITKTKYDPNAWTRSQLNSSMATNAWHRKMDTWRK